MEPPISEAQRLKEEAEIKERDRRRQLEKEERERKIQQERDEEERRRKEEEQRRIDEERRSRKAAEEMIRLGSNEILPLPPAPPSFVDDDAEGAMQAWYLSDDASSSLTMASIKPGRAAGSPKVTLKELRQLGVIYYRINLNDFSTVKQLVKERTYKYTDEVRVSQTNKDDTFLERWYTEHFNEDEQIRLVTDGSYYVDVRSKHDKWIRLHMHEGDLVIVASGLYHRSTLDEDDYVSVFRVFRDAPAFAPFFRKDPRSDSQKVRVNYLMNLKKGDVAAEMGFR